MAQVECGNCGLTFKQASAADSFCMVCELAIRAMEPPQHLKDMRWVYDGNQPRTPGEKQMSDLLAADKGRFLDRLTRFDDQYRATVAKKMPGRVVAEAPVWDGAGPCPTCKRAAQVVDSSVEECRVKAEAWLQSMAELHNAVQSN